MPTKKIVVRSINPGLGGRALSTYCVYRFDSTFDDIPLQTIASQPISSKDPIYHLQKLNGDYFIISHSEGVLLRVSDEVFARQYLHKIAIAKANTLVSKLEGFGVLDLTKMS